MNKKQRFSLVKIIIAAFGMILLACLPLPGVIKTLLSLSVYGLIGYDVLRKAGRGIWNRRILDENFLMALATLGAIALALYQKSYDFTEAIAVMLFYQVGELFESYAVGKSRKSIRALMDIRPDYANVMQDGVLVQVSPEDVPVGSIIIIQPGEKVPIDGVVCSGQSALDTGALTGESLPREIAEGDPVISGCINLSGVLQVQTTREFGESTVSKILALVAESSSRKSRSENFIARFARIYTPAVCCCALALGVLIPLFNLLTGAPGMWEIWLYRALTFLVISCPCALVISIPLSFFAGIGGASRAGILIKGSNYLEALSKVKTVALDKTGTLTKGIFQVTQIKSDGMDENALLEYAALAECASSHPISKGLLVAYGKELDRNRVSQVEELRGYGVTARVDSHAVTVGSRRMLESQGIIAEDALPGGTVVYVALDGIYAGQILLSDVIRPNAKIAIDRLKAAGIARTVMLTGDNEITARTVAGSLGITQVHSGLLPGDKVSLVEQLLSDGQGKVAFVGDGINDAPVLSRADVGIAMGGIGSDAAIEAADVVLMDDDPMKLPKAIGIAQRCMGIVYQNIFLSLGVKFACLLLGALGFANMWTAIFADVGVMVLAVLNAIRALNVKGL